MTFSCKLKARRIAANAWPMLGGFSIRGPPPVPALATELLSSPHSMCLVGVLQYFIAFALQRVQCTKAPLENLRNTNPQNLETPFSKKILWIHEKTRTWRAQ
jgi:hypothetical protein